MSGIWMDFEDFSGIFPKKDALTEKKNSKHSANN